MSPHRTQFLGKDPIFPLLIKLSVPATIGMLVNVLYNIVDTIFVGQGVGMLGIAALSIAFPIQLLVGALSNAIGIGAASIISRRLGENKNEQAARTAGTVLAANAVIVILMTALIYIFTDQLLRLFGATPTILPPAREYLQIVLVGFFFLSLSMTINGLLRAEGNAAIAMHGMVIGTVLNLILDPWFIFGMHWGIAGAAWATVISQLVAFLYYADFYRKKRSHVQLHREHFRIRFPLLKESFLLGLPNFIQMTGMTLIAIVINQSLNYYGGDRAIASYGLIHKLLSIIIMPLFGLVQGFQPIAGYNYGAQRFDRVREALRTAVATATVIASLGFSLLMLFPRVFVMLFTTDARLITATSHDLRIFIMMIPVIGLQFVGAVYFQAAGRKLQALLLSLSRQFIILIPLLLVLPRFFGLAGIWYSFPLADFLSTIITGTALTYELGHLDRKHVKRLKELEIEELEAEGPLVGQI
jgi:putative MATE family efflux protein